MEIIRIPRKPPPVVTGHFLAHARLSPDKRAFLAADARMGRRAFTAPTRQQSALLFGSSPPLVRAAERVSEHPELRARVEAGELSLLDAAGMLRPTRKSRPAGLLGQWPLAPHAERVALIHAHQAEVWDLLDQMTAADDGMPVPDDTSPIAVNVLA